MTASNTYVEPYGPLASQLGQDIGGTLSAALNFQKGVDGQQYYATDIRQLLVWDYTTFGMWTPADAKLLLQNPTVWITSTGYVVGNCVMTGGLTYYCLVAHTSGTFATDLAAGKWQLVNYPRFMFDDFRASALDTRYNGHSGGGSGAAAPAVVSGDAAGHVQLVTGTANGATACSALTAALSWLPSFTPPWQAVGATTAAGAGTFKQKSTLIARVNVSTLTSSFFLGFIDTLATSAGTSQTPFTLSAGALTLSTTNTGVSNAVGFLLDSTDNAHLWIASSNAGSVGTPVDTTTVSGAPAIAAGIDLYLKVTLDTSGNATFYMAPVPTTLGQAPQWVNVGAIASAVAPTPASSLALSPAAIVASRSATSVTLSIDAWGAT